MADTYPQVATAASGDVFAANVPASTEESAAAVPGHEEQRAAATDAALGQPSGMHERGLAALGRSPNRTGFCTNASPVKCPTI